MDSDHPYKNMWRKKSPTGLHRSRRYARATYLRTPHNSPASTAGLAAYHSGSGPVGAILVGLIAGVVTLVIGQIGFAAVRSPLIRAAIALLFAVPAAVAGYHATLDLAHIGVPSEGWREAFASVGAMIVGVTAWARMTLLAPPNVRQGVEAGPAQFPLSSAAREG